MNENLFYLAINIYHEARSETLAGQVAVGHVTINRAIRRNMSTREVVLEPNQFSWHNGDKLPPIKDYDAFLRALTAAKLTVRQRLEGVTLNHADHYYADYIDRPTWSMDMTEVAKVGVHTFYRS